VNDWDKIINFFIEMGIPYSYFDKETEYQHGDAPKKTRWLLSVTQAHFCFDKDKKFLGVMADELGYFDKRTKD